MVEAFDLRNGRGAGARGNPTSIVLPIAPALICQVPTINMKEQQSLYVRVRVIVHGVC